MSAACAAITMIHKAVGSACQVPAVVVGNNYGSFAFV